MTSYQPEIIAAAREHGLDANLVTAVVLQESSGKTHAYRYEASVAEWFKSNPKTKGLTPARYAASYGLLQVLYATATDYGFSVEPEYLFIPRIGLEFGAKHLAAMLKRCGGNVEAALASYNGGYGNKDKQVPRNYAHKVLALLEKVKAA